MIGKNGEQGAGNKEQTGSLLSLRSPTLLSGRGNLRAVRGITLLEILVAMGVFLIAVNAITAVYQSASRLQQRVLAKQRVVNDLRFILESVAEDARIGIIDYARYGATGTTLVGNADASACREDGDRAKVAQGWCTRLLLIDEDGVKYTIARSTVAATCSNDGGGCLTKIVTDKGTASTAQVLDAKGVMIDSVDFYIQPTVNPFCAPTQQGHPLVTIVLTGHSRELPAPVQLQTTVSSRVYRWNNKVWGACEAPTT